MPLTVCTGGIRPPGICYRRLFTNLHVFLSVLCLFICCISAMHLHFTVYWVAG